MEQIVYVYGKKNKYTQYLEDILKSKYQIDTIEYETCNNFHELLLKGDYKYIIVHNLIGFEQTTLTGGIFYNILNSKIINILSESNLENEKYLFKQISISMFFIFLDQNYCEYISEKYPHIPYIKEVPSHVTNDTEMENETNILAAIAEIIKECSLS